MTTTTPYDRTGSGRSLEFHPEETAPNGHADSLFIRCATFSRMGSNKVTPYNQSTKVDYQQNDPDCDFSFQKPTDSGHPDPQIAVKSNSSEVPQVYKMAEYPQVYKMPKAPSPRRSPRPLRMKLKAEDPPKRRGCSKHRRCICMSSTVLVLALLGIVTFLIAYYRPELPILEMGDIHVAKFSRVDLGSTFQLNTSADFSLQIFNSNEKAVVYYKEVTVSIFYRGEILGSTVIPGFKQKENSWTTIQGAVDETGAVVETSAGITHLRTQLANSDVALELRALVEGQYQMLGIPLQEFDMPLECKVHLNPGGNGTEQPQVTTQNCFYMTPVTVMM